MQTQISLILQSRFWISWGGGGGGIHFCLCSLYKAMGCSADIAERVEVGNF